MPECHEKAPPLYRTNPERAVACYLYKNAEEVTGNAMADALAV
ncbi:MAG: hypothetical protein R3C14_39660 [Caldilineaceae bacterium]